MRGTACSGVSIHQARKAKYMAHGRAGARNRPPRSVSGHAMLDVIEAERASMRRDTPAARYSASKAIESLAARRNRIDLIIIAERGRSRRYHVRDNARHSFSDHIKVAN